jgi:hypothetical protein
MATDKAARHKSNPKSAHCRGVAISKDYLLLAPSRRKISYATMGKVAPTECLNANP